MMVNIDTTIEKHDYNKLLLLSNLANLGTSKVFLIYLYWYIYLACFNRRQ